MSTGFVQRFKGKITAVPAGLWVGAFQLPFNGIANEAVGLTAVGTSRANALQLSAVNNFVATAASSAVGVILPAALGPLPGTTNQSMVLGTEIFVYNDGPSNAFNVYASSLDTIDTIAGSTGVVLTNAYFCMYVLSALSSTVGAWVSYRFPIVRSA